jgi:hypothetical protein
MPVCSQWQLLLDDDDPWDKPQPPAAKPLPERYPEIAAKLRLSTEEMLGRDYAAREARTVSGTQRHLIYGLDIPPLTGDDHYRYSTQPIQLPPPGSIPGPEYRVQLSSGQSAIFNLIRMSVQIDGETIEWECWEPLGHLIVARARGFGDGPDNPDNYP